MIFLLVLLVSSSFALSTERIAFHLWKSKYHKVYSSSVEEEIRFSNFLVSMERVQKKQALTALKGHGAKFGLTKFSDLSVEEFRSTILMKNKISPNHTKPMPPKPVAVPPTVFDWRSTSMVTHVKDQGQCGSCWAFSATETIESAWMLKYNLNNVTMKPLAPQQIVDCDMYMMGCGGGQSTSALSYVMDAGGIETNADYPYQGVNGACNFQATEVYAKVQTWEYACSYFGESDLMANTYQYGPSSICVDASNWQDYQSGIMTADQCAYINLLDHCVQAVGWNLNAAQPYWSVRNSWNTDWGENGYIRLAYGTNTCGLTYDATYVISG